MKIRKYRFKNLPFKRSREVIYVENQKNEHINDLIIQFLQANDDMPDSPEYDYLSKIYRANGRVFWYVPYLGSCLANYEDIINEYNFTSEERNRLRSLSNSWILDYLDNPSERLSFQPSILYWDNDNQSYDGNDGISVLNAVAITHIKDWLDVFSVLLNLPKIHINDGIKYFNFPDTIYSDDENFKLSAYLYNKPKYKCVAASYQSLDPVEELRAARKIKKFIYNCLKIGLPFEFISERVLECRPIYSLQVTEDYNIIIHKAINEEIVECCPFELPAIQKALYFLYLRHPEGIRFKELCDYQNELTQLYSVILGRAINKKEEGVIESLIKGKKSANQKRSKIKGTLDHILGEITSNPYIISGDRGDPLKITLDREYVTWDCADIESIPKDHVKQPPKIIKLE